MLRVYECWCWEKSECLYDGGVIGGVSSEFTELGWILQLLLFNVKHRETGTRVDSYLSLPYSDTYIASENGGPGVIPCGILCAISAVEVEPPLRNRSSG